MTRLKGKVALITGASGGIGRSTSNLFLKEGAKVILIDKNGDELNKTVEDLSSKNIKSFQADVTSEDEMNEVISSSEKIFGNLDIAFLNAGVEGPVKSLFDYSSEEFDRVMKINVKGVFYGLKACALSMIEKKKGSIIITSSLAGIRGMPKISGYVAGRYEEKMVN